jgi:anti-anti-sigma factor
MEAKKLEINVEFEGGWQVLVMKGRLDATTSAQAQEAILGNLSSITPKLSVNAAGLDYLSSAGIRSLLMGAQKARGIAGGAFAVVEPSDIVRRILVDCGLDSMLGMSAR